MRRAPTTLATKATALLRHGESLGIDRSRLLAAARLSPAALEHRHGRVASEAVEALWEELGHLTRHPDLGLRVAESEIAPDAFGVVGFRAMTSGTLDESLRSFVRHNQVVNGGAEARLAETPDALVFEMDFPLVPRHLSRFMVDRALGSCVRFARGWTGEALRPRVLRLRHEKPHDTSAYQRIFDCAVEFAAPSNAIVFDRAAATLPLRVPMIDLALYLESIAEAARVDLPSDDAGRAVSDLVRGSLSTGAPSINKVARRLGLSERTLQRRLLAEGLTYHGVVDQVRREAAVALVVSTRVPLGVVGERVGYLDTRAFRRAFRRWTGLSPAELRRAAPITPPERSPFRD